MNMLTMNMRKTISMLVALIMIFGLFIPAVIVSAAIDVQISVDTVTCAPGETIRVPVRLSQVPEGMIFPGVQVDVEFDKTKLEYIGGHQGTIVTSYMPVGTNNLIISYAVFNFTNPSVANGNGKVGAIFNDTTAPTASIKSAEFPPNAIDSTMNPIEAEPGILYYLEFKVKEGVTDSSIPLTIVYAEIGEHTTNTKYYKDSARDEIPVVNGAINTGMSGDIDKEITAVEELGGIEVDFGTPFAELGLPATVSVTLDDSSTATLSVNWSDVGYDPNQAGTYTLYGDLVLTEGILNSAGLKAEIRVTVKEQVIPDKKIVSVAALDPIEVDYGTAFVDLNLPATVVATLEDSSTVNVSVNWSDAGYNPNVAGTYRLEGTLTNLPEKVINPDDVKAYIDVTVKKEDIPLDTTLYTDINKAQAEPGEQFIVTVKLANPNGGVGIEFVLGYNKDVFEVVDVVEGADVVEKLTDSNVFREEGKVKFIAVDLDEFASPVAEVAKIVFVVKSGAQPGTYNDFSLSNIQLGDEDSNPITVTVGKLDGIEVIPAVEPSIISVKVEGAEVVGETLTVDVAYEVGGYSNPQLTYKWYRVTDTTETEIGSNAASYTITSADIGSKIKVVVELRVDGYEDVATGKAVTANAVIARGDVNGDGNINVLDVIKVLQALSSIAADSENPVSGLDMQAEAAADFNNDGVLDADDVIDLLAYIVENL